MPASPATHPRADTPSAPPWWRYRMVWLVFALPAAVVFASLVTAAIAWRHADQQVLDVRPQATTAGAQAGQGPGDGALEPAVQARNHAATPKP